MNHTILCRNALGDSYSEHTAWFFLLQSILFNHEFKRITLYTALSLHLSDHTCRICRSRCETCSLYPPACEIICQSWIRKSHNSTSNWSLRLLSPLTLCSCYFSSYSDSNIYVGKTDQLALHLFIHYVIAVLTAPLPIPFCMPLISLLSHNI